jgi:hypothetical protein
MRQSLGRDSRTIEDHNTSVEHAKGGEVVNYFSGYSKLSVSPVALI